MGTLPVNAVVASDPIESVECFDCVVPLPSPLKVGSAWVTERTYAVVRLRTRDGIEGAAYTYGRSLPVAALIRDALAPRLIGADSATPENLRAMLAGAYWPYAAQGLVQVAISALDLALWDAQGKRLGASLADLLGRRTNTAMVCGVAGYTKGDGNELTDLQAELQSLVDQGIRSFKLTIGAGSPELDENDWPSPATSSAPTARLLSMHSGHFAISMTHCVASDCSSRTI